MNTAEVTLTLGFEIRYRPIDLQGQKRAFLIDRAGRERMASAEEARLWDALLAAQARLVELEAERDAHEGEAHETRRKRKG